MRRRQTNFEQAVCACKQISCHLDKNKVSVCTENCNIAMANQSDYFFSKLSRQLSEQARAGIQTQHSIHDHQAEANDQSDHVTGIEKSYALDTAALLGGNEYLVSQLLDDQHRTLYLPEEIDVLKWALLWLWGEKDYCHILDVEEKYKQNTFTHLLTTYNRQNLARILANCLLFCGRYEDTEILQNPKDHSQRILLVNLRNLPHMSLPLAEIGPTKRPCHRIAMIYRKRDAGKHSAAAHSSSRPRSLTRKISASMAIEKTLLNQIHMIAVVPVP